MMAILSLMEQKWEDRIDKDVGLNCFADIMRKEVWSHSFHFEGAKYRVVGTDVRSYWILILTHFNFHKGDPGENYNFCLTFLLFNNWWIQLDPRKMFAKKWHNIKIGFLQKPKFFEKQVGYLKIKFLTTTFFGNFCLFAQIFCIFNAIGRFRKHIWHLIDLIEEFEIYPNWRCKFLIHDNSYGCECLTSVEMFFCGHFSIFCSFE